jgi:hypothetical protein
LCPMRSPKRRSFCPWAIAETSEVEQRCRIERDGEWLVRLDIHGKLGPGDRGKTRKLVVLTERQDLYPRIG